MTLLPISGSIGMAGAIAAAALPGTLAGDGQVLICAKSKKTKRAGAMRMLSVVRGTAALSLVLAALPAAAATPPVISEVPTIAGNAPSAIVASGSGDLAYFTDFTNDKIGIAPYSAGLGAIENGGPLGPAGNGVVGIAIGATATAPDADPSVWVTVSGTAPAIVMVNPSTGAAIRSFPLGNAYDAPELIAFGPDGNLWFPIQPRSCSLCSPAPVAAIGRITPEGVPTLVTAGLVAGSAPLGIAAGPDGALWFTDPNSKTPAIGRVTTAAAPVIAEFTNTQSPGLSTTSIPVAIAADADGHLWFTDQNSMAPAIGRITPATVEGQPPAIVEFPLPLVKSAPVNIALGSDGNIWFTDRGCPNCATPVPPAIGRITPDGTSLIEFTISEFSGGAVGSSWPEGITGSGPGGPGSVFYADSLGAIGQVVIPTDTLKVAVNGITGTSSAAADRVTSKQGPGVTGVLAQALIHCEPGGSACAAAFPDATTVRLTAAPAPGETFTGWSGAGAAAGGCTTAPVCAVPLAGNVDSSITASFSAAAGQHYQPQQAAVFSGDGAAAQQRGAAGEHEQ
jgi:virginiamycin B lyase